MLAKASRVCVLAVLLAALAASSVLAIPAPTRVEDDDSRLVFTGGWVYRWDVSRSGSTAHVTSTRGASMRAQFEGTSVSLVSPTGPRGGRVEVSVDGTAPVVLSLYSANPADSGVVWDSGELAVGQHTLTTRVLGSHEASSAGSSVTIDAIDVVGTMLEPGDSGIRIVEQTDSHLYRKGDWESREASGASGGSALHTGATKASISLRFKGTSVAWLGRRTPAGGSAEVLLDGKRVATVGTAGNDRERVVLWAASGLRRRAHTLTVRVTGEPSAPATLGADVDVDAFAVRGSVLTAYRPTPFHYPWGTYILIDKSQFRLYWVKDGMLVKSYPIAHGRRWGWTPARVWRIDQKYPHTGGVYGPRKMRLFKRVRTRHGYAYARTAYGIHGTNQPWVIGTMASHGCIRMYNRDVRDLYPRVPMHTMVITRD